jgi:hypothetical protein
MGRRPICGGKAVVGADLRWIPGETGAMNRLGWAESIQCRESHRRSALRPRYVSLRQCSALLLATRSEKRARSVGERAQKTRYTERAPLRSAPPRSAPPRSALFFALRLVEFGRSAKK